MSGHDHDPARVHGITLPVPGKARRGRVLTIRANSGLSGDIMLAGLARMLDASDEELGEMAGAIMPELAGCVRVERASVRHIGGWRAVVELPRQHAHRTLDDILSILDAASMTPAASEWAVSAFSLLARAEGNVHGLPPADVRFHEVGALDSVLDIGLACELMARLSPDAVVVSPIPLADGQVRCAHGVLGTPAPAVLELLPGIPVTSFAGTGETITPTAAALLKVLPVTFGPWPSMTPERVDLVFGSTVFDNAPNGAIFALGVGEVVAGRG